MTPASRVIGPATRTTIRLQPRDVEHIEIIKDADSVGTRTEAIQRALEDYARKLKRRNVA